MNKENFIIDLKKCLHLCYNKINEIEKIFSFGIYTDGDANTIGLYYNTFEYLQGKLAEAKKEDDDEFFDPLYYLFFMEEWKKDISEYSDKDLLDNLSQRLYDFGSEQYEKGNENYKNEKFDLLTSALIEFQNEHQFENTSNDFFLHLEVSDSWIGEDMLSRISTIHPESRFLEYQEYAKNNNAY